MRSKYNSVSVAAVSAAILGTMAQTSHTGSTKASRIGADFTADYNAFPFETGQPQHIRC